MLGRGGVSLQNLAIDGLRVGILGVTETLARHPGLNCRLAERTVQDTDGHAQFLMELVGEGEGNGAIISIAAVLPGAVGFLNGVKHRHHAGHFKLPDGRRLALGFLHERLRQPYGGTLVHLPLHIGLPRSQPDFAHQHVPQRDTLTDAVRHLQFGGFGAGPQWVQRKHPFAGLIRHRRLRLASEFYRDLCPRLAPPPDRYHHAPLENGIVPERRALLDGRV